MPGCRGATRRPELSRALSCWALVLVLARTACAQAPGGGRSVGHHAGFANRPRVAVLDSKVFIAYEHTPLERGRPDIFLVISEDSGRTFSSPIKLTDGPLSHYSPALTVGPRSGSLYLSWVELDPEPAHHGSGSPARLVLPRPRLSSQQSRYRAPALRSSRASRWTKQKTST